MQKRTYLHDYHQEHLRRVTQEELKLLQDDVEKRYLMARPKFGEKFTILTNVVTDRGIVCLECGAILETLNQHLGEVHKLTAKKYRQNWGYRKRSPLCSARFSQRMSKTKKYAGLEPPRETRFGESLGPSPQQGTKARQKEGLRLEAREKLRARMKGKGLSDRWIVTDWGIARFALQGKSPKQIASKVRMKPSTVASRLKKMFFPVFKAGPYRFRHGEVSATRRLRDTMEDFDLRPVELARLMDIPPPNLYRRLSYPDDFPLPLEWDRRLERVRKKLRRERPPRPASLKGGRPRELLPSEEKQIRRQYRKLVSDLLQLRKWLENFDEDVGAKARRQHVWNWLCQHRRLGKIHVLLFWPPFFDWLEKTFKRAYLQGKSTAKLGKPLALVFLADSYHVSVATVRRAVWPKRY